MTHTPTPWTINKEANRGRSIDGGKHAEIATCWLCVGSTGKEMEANAARIVACVNACDGISNEALDAGVIAELVQALKIARGYVKDTSNGLDISEYTEMAKEDLAEIDAAIAKATP